MKISRRNFLLTIFSVCTVRLLMPEAANKNFKPLEVKNIKHYWIIDSKVDF
jgi:hypothetical protein